MLYRLNKHWTIEPDGRRWCLARRSRPGAVPDFCLYADKPEELAAFAQQYAGGVDQKVLGRLRQGGDAPRRPRRRRRCRPDQAAQAPASS